MIVLSYLITISKWKVLIEKAHHIIFKPPVILALKRKSMARFDKLIVNYSISEFLSKLLCIRRSSNHVIFTNKHGDWYVSIFDVVKLDFIFNVRLAVNLKVWVKEHKLVFD